MTNHNIICKFIESSAIEQERISKLLEPYRHLKLEDLDEFKHCSFITNLNITYSKAIEDRHFTYNKVENYYTSKEEWEQTITDNLLLFESELKCQSFEEALDAVLKLSDEQIMALPTVPKCEDLFYLIDSRKALLNKAEKEETNDKT